MKKWLLLVIGIIAVALITVPATAYIAVKPLPGETMPDGAFTYVLQEEGVYGTLSQTVPVGWTICVHWPYDNNDARAVNGFIQFPDSILPVSGFGPAGTYWVHTVDTPMGWFDESEDITVLPGFNYYVTINPVIDKMDWIEGPE